MLRVVRAAATDVGLVSGILCEAASRLIARGEPLWKLEDLHPARIAPTVLAGEAVLAYRDGVAVGAAFVQPVDPVFWPEVPLGEAWFVHKLAVRSGAAGLGVAAGIVGWARLEAAKAGCRFVRLDCDDRPKLRVLYESMGFRHRDTRLVGAFVVCRYEWPLEDEGA